MRRSRRIPVGVTLDPEMLGFANAVSDLGAPGIEVRPGSRSDIVNDALRMMAEALGIRVTDGMAEADFRKELSRYQSERREERA